MKKETIVIIVIAVIVGMLGGLLVFSIINKQGKTSLAGIPAGAGSPLDYQQRIAEAEKIVTADPKNLQAWVQLGNDYYDTDQVQKGINAYDKALELKPGNPDVLTDQGVLYRRARMFQKALENFEKAQRLDPNHLQSLYNIGVVYSTDLNRPDKALQAWNRYLELDPMSPQGQQVKSMVEDLKSASRRSLK